MTRTKFHQGLDELKQNLLVMGGMAEQAVQRAITAYRNRDFKLCELVMESEQAINQKEREIDELARDLLAMQQPMAIDLRLILAVIKINADLERVGDQAVNIVQRVMHMNGLPQVELPADIPRMAAAASGMVKDALEAFIEGNAELAQKVLITDDEVDRMNRETFVAMESVMASSPEVLHQALDVLLIARNLERIADHATNIAEDVIFWVRGADVRHRMFPSAQGSGT